MTSDTTTIAWPRKSGEIDDPLMDSARWNDFVFRDDDIVIATYPKCGTTLTQQIVGQLVFDGDATVFGLAHSPWLDARLEVDTVERLNAQAHRRFIKTHLPVRNLVISRKARYIFIGRDVRDVIWSFHNHLRGFRPESRDHVLAATGREPPPPPPEDIREYYHGFLDGRRTSEQAFWPFIQGWWNVRRLPNVLLLHYRDIIADLPAAFRQIAAFLDYQIDEAKLPSMVGHCSLAHMRKVAADNALLNTVFVDGAKTFINKGTNGRWREVLTPDEIARADEIAARELTPDCARWLRDGGPA